MNTSKRNFDSGNQGRDLPTLETPKKVGLILPPLTPEQKKMIEGDFKKVWGTYFGVMGAAGLLWLVYSYIFQ